MIKFRVLSSVREFVREHHIALSALVVLLVLLAAANYTGTARANIVRFYPSSCLGGWDNPQNAAGAPSGDMVQEGEYAVLKNSLSQIFCGSFRGEQPDEALPQLVTLRFAWEVKTADVDKGEPEPVEPEPAPTPAQEELELPPVETPEIEEPTTTDETTSWWDGDLIHRAFAEEEANPSGDGDNFLQVLYTLDNEHWHPLGFVNKDNWRDTSFTLPFTNWEDVEKVQVSLQSLPVAGDAAEVYLDSMWLEVKYGLAADPVVLGDYSELPRVAEATSTPVAEISASFAAGDEPVIFIDPELIQPEKVAVPVEPEVETVIDKIEKDVGARQIEVLPIIEGTTIPDVVPGSPETEAPAVDTPPPPSTTDTAEPETQPTSYWSKLLPRVLADEVPTRILLAEVYGPDGELTDLDVDTDYRDNKWRMRIEHDEDAPNFKPGVYRLRVELLKDGTVYVVDRGFAWGVLAINTNKSVYLPGDRAYLQFASLDATGHTRCDEPLELEVTSPSGDSRHFSTHNESIQLSGECGNDNVVETPDYFAYYRVDGEGEYTAVLTNTRTGYSVIGTFRVSNHVPISVERIGATRINPFASGYQMRLRVTPDKDFSGKIVETVPATFDISNDPAYEWYWRGRAKEIVWPVDLRAGETVTLSYKYEAPRISPELFLLGPLHIANNHDHNVFDESKKWQLASDAVTATLLTSGADTTNTTSYTTASISPSANKLILLSVMSTRTSGNVTAPTSVTGNGLTWTQVNNVTFPSQAGVAFRRNVSVWRAMDSSPTSGAVTLSFGVNQHAGASWVVTEFSNVSTLGSGGSVAVVRSTTGTETNNSTGTSLSLTLSSLSNTNNATVGGFGLEGTSTATAINPGSGYSELAESAHNNPAAGAEMEWRADGATTVDISYSDGAYVSGGVALELAHATSTVSGTANGNNGATVKVALNGTAQAQTATISSGTWSISSVAVTSGDVVTVWVDGVSDANESTAVTKYDGSGDITGMVLNTNVVSVGSVDNPSLTVTNLSQYDADNDEDIMYSANSGTLAVEGASNSYSDETISILSGATLTIGGSEALTTDNVTVSGTLASGGSSTFTVVGDWTNSGTFTANSSTVTLSGSATQTLSGTLTGSSAFYNLTITNSSGTNPSDCEITSWVPSVDFAASASTTNNYTATTALTRVEYNSGSLYTFQNVNWNGQAVGTPLYFRNSAASGSWVLYVPGTRTAISYLNVSRSDASGTTQIDASDGTNTNCNNNTNWSFSSLTFAVDSNSQTFPTLTPGTLVATSSILTVKTGNSTGFNITVVRDDSDTTMDLSTDATVNISDKTAWSPGVATTSAGNATASTTEPLTLQFRVRSSGTDTPNYASTWWGNDDTTANALFAGFPSTAKKIIDRSTSAAATTTAYLLYNLNVDSTQRTGVYSGSVTYTTTANP